MLGKTRVDPCGSLTRENRAYIKKNKGTTRCPLLPTKVSCYHLRQQPGARKKKNLEPAWLGKARAEDSGRAGPKKSSDILPYSSPSLEFQLASRLDSDVPNWSALFFRGECRLTKLPLEIKTKYGQLHCQHKTDNLFEFLPKVLCAKRTKKKEKF